MATKELFGSKAPEKACTDKKCPFHGEINVKKEINHSATIEWSKSFYVPKYERYEMRRSRMRVHNPPCLDAKIGQEVLAAKTRPMSKTKNHVIIQVLA